MSCISHNTTVGRRGSLPNYHAPDPPPMATENKQPGIEELHEPEEPKLKRVIKPPPAFVPPPPPITTAWIAPKDKMSTQNTTRNTEETDNTSKPIPGRPSCMSCSTHYASFSIYHPLDCILIFTAHIYLINVNTI